MAKLVRITKEDIDSQLNRMNRNLAPCGAKAEFNSNMLFIKKGDKQEVLKDFNHDTKNEVYKGLYFINLGLEAKGDFC